MSTGTTVQVIGAVVDVEFPAGQIPKVYDALVIDDAEITLEVQQQLGDGVVRTIAMGSSEGLKRGMPVTNTGQPISVPVGEKTLGRIMDVLGKPIDNKGDIGAEQHHRCSGGQSHLQGQQTEDFVVIDDAGHSPQFESPSAWRGEISGFLDTVRSSR